MTYIEGWNADIRVSLDGQPLFDSWATLSGGVITSADAKTRPGGMGREVSVGGPSTRDDLTATIQFDDVVAAQHKSIESKIGTSRVKVTVNWLAPNRTIIPGSGFSRVGTLKSAQEPNADHNTSDVGMYTLVVSCDELPA